MTRRPSGAAKRTRASTDPGQAVDPGQPADLRAADPGQPVDAGRAQDPRQAGYAEQAAVAAATAAANVASSDPAPPAGPPETLADVALTVFQPNATSVDAGFFSWEIASGEVNCDPVTYRMHGLRERASTSMAQFLSRVPEPDMAQVMAAMQRIVANCGAYQIEYRVIADDGTLRSMEARGRVMPGPDGRPVRMLGLVMDTTAARVRREAERRRSRERQDRARRTHEFTAALASAMSVEAIVTAAQEGLRAYGADGFIMVADREGHLEVVASCGFDKDSLAALSGLDAVTPTPISTAMQWRSPVYLYSPQAMAEDYPHLADIIDRSQQQAWVALPVPDSRGQVGACLFGFPEPHEFALDERALLSAASGMLGQSLERARMHEAEHALATELQRGMLPRGMLTAPGMTIATRYQAATSGMEIGGDFYDVVPLPDGQVALVIGDVQGHNLLAASLMGRLRTAVHAYAREGHDPSAVMARANQWLADLNTDPDLALFATCCYVVANPGTGELAVCRAGHPPPVLLTPGTQPQVLDCDGGLPLGVDADTEYASTTMRVSPGSVLALTTDGLLETDAGDDYNLRCLLDALARGPVDDLEILADDLLGSPRRPPRHGDDVALLLARLDGPPQAGDGD